MHHLVRKYLKDNHQNHIQKRLNKMNESATKAMLMKIIENYYFGLQINDKHDQVKSDLKYRYLTVAEVAFFCDNISDGSNS